MGRILGFLVAFSLVVTGLLMAWPAARALITLQRANGEIIDAFAVAEGGGRSRITILYRFPVAGTGAAQIHQLACRQADQNYRPIPDPLLPEAEAERVVRDLLAGNRERSVLYRANDPEGSAFILEEVGGRPGRRALTGLALAAVGVLWWVAIRRRRSH